MTNGRFGDEWYGLGSGSMFIGDAGGGAAGRGGGGARDRYVLGHISRLLIFADAGSLG